MEEARLQLDTLRELLPDHVRILPEEKQIEYISELLSHHHRHQREQEEKIKAYEELCKTIKEHYRPLHAHLYELRGWEFVPGFREGVESGDEGRMRTLLKEETSGVFTFDMLTAKCCGEFVEEVSHFEKWCKENKLRINRPNTMNRYGVILDDFGFKQVLDELVQKYIQPFATFLYPVLGQRLDSHHGFVVEYELGKDINLGFHVDDSEVTLNVCLGRVFTGGQLYFKGVRCDRHVNTEPREGECYDLEHSIGKGILHVGRHRHGARDLSNGNRCNLILWCRSSSQREGCGHRCNCHTHTPCYSWCGMYETESSNVEE